MYKKQIEEFIPRTKEEIEDKSVVLEFIEEVGDKILFRESRIAHLTASAFIVNEELTKTLMIHHNIYDSWGWTGGHVDGDRDLTKVALKEAIEETGVEEFEFLTKDMIALDVISVPKHYKKGKFVSEHIHMNATYVLIACEKKELFIKEDENSGVKWIKIEDIENEVREKDMIGVYKRIIERAKEVVKEKKS